MTEPEKFLERWSRRKRVAAEPPENPAASDPGVPPSPAADGAPGDKPDAGSMPATPEAPVFDPASLPSIDSIGAQTDISAFLKQGVPGDLKLAALRRAWSMDPAIRDFKGLQENDWNFNDPNGIPGFGELGPNFDVKKMLGDLFGETPRTDESHTAVPSQDEQLTPPSQEISSPAADVAHGSIEQTTDLAQNSEQDPAAAAVDDGMVRREENIAMQNDDEKIGYAQNKRRRSQGRALPE